VSRWPLAQLRHIARFEYGDSLAAEIRVDGEVPVFGSNGRVGWHDRPNTGGPAIVIGRKGSYGQVNYSNEPVFAIDTTYFIDPTTTSNDLRWLYYAMGTARLTTLGQDVGVPGLNRDLAYGQRIPLPPLSEQRAIADYLDAETARIDALIAKKEQLIHLLEERIDALLDEYFSPGPLDLTVRLARLARVQTGVTLNAGKVNTGNTVRLPYLRVANVQPGWLDLSEVKEVDVDLAAAARSLLQPGDVLMTEGGDIDKLGRGTEWRGEVENCLHQNHVFAVRPRPGELDSGFLANVTRTSHARAYFESTGVQSTNLASTNSSKVADFRIPALDIEAQRSRCASYEHSSLPIRESSEKLVRQIDLLAEHRQALVTAAVTGEFAVPGAA
jgi:type I restriction enzyme S subunit